MRRLLPKPGDQPLENAALGPAPEPDVDCVPFSEQPRQRTPFAAVLHDAQNRVDENDIGNPHVPALNRQEERILAYCFAVICFMIVHRSIFISFLIAT